jgi:hypothetical protein
MGTYQKDNVGGHYAAFKKETGLTYTNEEEPLTNLNEDFTLPPNGDELTTNILDNMEV